MITKEGITIQETSESKTMIRLLQMIGLKRVYEACWTKFWEQEKTMQSLISTEHNINQSRGEHELEENGIIYYVNTKTDTPKKKLQLDNLNRVLNLGWDIRIEGGDQ